MMGQKLPHALFLDTEWADDDGRDLVSLALVHGGPYGLFMGEEFAPFYAERAVLPRPNAFVKSVVYPALDRGESAIADEVFSRTLAAYIEGCRNIDTDAPPIIIATHANDFTLLRATLALTGQTPPYREELRFAESLLDLIRVAFAKDPALAKRRHHALVDAQVLKSVYRGWFKIGKPCVTHSTLFQHYDQNDGGRDFAVGDIHGHFPALERLLRRVHFDRARDRLFSVGDLIDRGPESARFVEYVAEPWFHAVRGNHEQMMIDAACWPDEWEMWRDNGGRWATDFASPTMIDALRDHADRLPFGIEVATPAGLVGLIHAGLPYKTWGEFREDVHQTGREHDPAPVMLGHAQRPSPYFHAPLAPWWSQVLYSRSAASVLIKRGYLDVLSAYDVRMLQTPDLHALVSGHTPALGKGVLHGGNTWLIDTGAGRTQAGAALTVLDLQTYQAISEPTWPVSGP